MFLAASAIRARPSGLIDRFVFLPGLLVCFSAAASAALFSAHRLRVASAIRARPSALIRLFPPRAFLPGGRPRCQELQAIYDSHQRTLNLMRAFGPLWAQRKKAPEREVDRQQGLFDVPE